MRVVMISVIFFVLCTGISKSQNAKAVLNFKKIDTLLINEKAFTIHMLENGYRRDRIEPNNGSFWYYGNSYKNATSKVQYFTDIEDGIQYGMFMVLFENKYLKTGEDAEIMELMKIYYPIKDVEEVETITRNENGEIVSSKFHPKLLYYSKDRRYKAEILYSNFYQFCIVISCEGVPLK